MREIQPKQFISLLGGLFAIALLISGCQRVVDVENDGTAVDEEVEAEGEVDTSDWLTYRSEEFGFEFRYPGDQFRIKDNEEEERNEERVEMWTVAGYSLDGIPPTMWIQVIDVDVSLEESLRNYIEEKYNTLPEYYFLLKTDDGVYVRADGLFPYMFYTQRSGVNLEFNIPGAYFPEGAEYNKQDAMVFEKIIQSIESE